MLALMKERPFGRWLVVADRHPTATDAIVAAGFVVFGLAWLPTSWPEPSPLSPAVAVVLVLALYAPLAWRRRKPLATLVAVTAVVAVYALFGFPKNAWFGNGWMLAAYSAGVYGAGRWRTGVRVGSAVAFAAFIVVAIVAQDGVPGGPGLPGNPVLGVGLLIVTNAAVVGWIWIFGDVARASRRREAELAERTWQLEREREANARRAVLDERLRIARELHDVVAHHVSVMGVQAGAARRILPTRPEQATELLAAVEATGREAIGELHRLLGFLRREEEDRLAPQPSMRRLPALVDQMRAAGLPVELTVEGAARPLPPGVDLSAYRIVQEALINALKHAGPATAAVTVRYGDQALDIDVRDDGAAASPAASPAGENGAGAGLIGMRERVGLLGGRLRVGRRPGAGFAVHAHLPLGGDRS